MFFSKSLVIENTRDGAKGNCLLCTVPRLAGAGTNLSLVTEVRIMLLNHFYQSAETEVEVLVNAHSC